MRPPAAVSASLILTLLATSGCVLFRPAETFPRLVEEYAYARLAMSPVTATLAGYHLHRSVSLDELLDDYSPASLADQRKYLEGFRTRWSKIDRAALTPQEQADYDLVNDALELHLLEFDSIQSYKRAPQLYVETVGNALFAPFSLTYAPDAVRYSHIIKRLEKIPALIEQAKGNLTDAPPTWVQVAIEENEGNLALIDKTIRRTVPESMRQSYDRAAGPAMQSLRGFNDWMRNTLVAKPSDWRMPTDLYARKLRLALGVDRTPNEVLEEAERLLAEYRAQMEALAGKEGVKAALDRIAKRHATPETYFADARRDLAEATAFVKEKKLLRLPERSTIEVIETPEFLRGIYSVGGFSPAPALEPQLGSFYWLTPIPDAWPPERKESKLREYNFYGLKILTVHEAMPGHFVQFEYANRVQPAARRLVRSTMPSGPYVEGWAVYATQMMLEQGYYGEDRDMRLSFLKHMLRAISNAILDVRLHTRGMSEEEALKLMIEGTYQEREEAVGKWQRAQLSSTQLATYFVGWREWVRLREAEQKRLADRFSLSAFHEKALEQGGVSMRSLPGLLY